MKQMLIATLLLVAAFKASGQRADTVSISKQDLEIKNVRPGKSTYVVYFKKTPTSPAERITLVKISVESTVVGGRKVFAITQHWDSGDDVIHTSYTLHDASDFSTVLHESWWKRLGYSARYDFTTRQVEFKGAIDELAKARIVEDFNQSFANYNLCWHSDLTIFPMFPYRAGGTFVVNFYDPGFGKAEEATYQVTGSESLVAGDGSQIDCWTMEHKFDDPDNGVSGTQRFWISKRTREVLKEEDQMGPRGFRYKLKIGISGEE